MRYLYLLILCISMGSNVLAYECNFERKIGECRGVIEFVKGYGSKPSFAAEFIVHSSAPRCSKVEYLIDNTPNQTILKNANQAAESTFGTSPISANSIIYTACSVYESSSSSEKGGSEERNQRLDFSGSWKGSCPGAPGWWGGGGAAFEMTMQLQIDQQSITGTMTDRTNGKQASLSGNITNESGSYTTSWGSRHSVKASANGSQLVDNWCNKDGGCAQCVYRR